jgi:chemotaxis protein methyltransferase CheR
MIGTKDDISPSEMSSTASSELSDQQLRYVQSLVYRLSGIHLHDGKRQLVEHRLSRRLRDRQLVSYAQYIELLKQPGETAELQRCLNALTTNETFFFRHKQHWDFIASQVVPAWKTRHRLPRAWSAACSTGEEPYSLAILLSELLPTQSAVIDATDINDAVLRTAKTGLYGT